MAIAFVNGEFVDTASPSIKPMDIGLLRGYGVYEGITSYGGKIFRLKDHYDRLLQSAGFLKIAIPFSLEEVENILLELIKRNGFPRTDFRLVLTGGETVHGIDFIKSQNTFVVIAEEHNGLPESAYEEGVSVLPSEFQREFAKYKTLNYIHAVRLQDKCREAGATEILYHHNKLALEASTSNVFAVVRGSLITPKENILYGITRKVVLELAEKAGMRVEERDLPMEELLSADEVFITSSFKEVVPVVKVGEGRTIAGGRPGEKTQEIARLFREYALG